MQERDNAASAPLVLPTDAVGSSTDVPGLDGASARALAAHLRAEFQTPVVALTGLIEAAIEDAAKAGRTDYDADLHRMRDAADRLLQLVTETVLASLETEKPVPLRQVRHDLRTPIASVLGYGELLSETAEEDGEGAIVDAMREILNAANDLLQEVDNLVAFAGRTEATAADEVPGPVKLRRLADEVERIREGGPKAHHLQGRILVVDDNRAMRDLLCRRLVREGHDVQSADSGEDALERLGREPFDLLLLDLMMPGLSGLQVMEKLRPAAGASSVPVIVISALDDVEAAVSCIQAGADDYLSKPVNETLLRARITSSLERKFLKDREQDALARLEHEQARSEGLLRNVLPESIVARLRTGERRIADHFDSVSVLFCDLVGFTGLSARLTPADTLGLLNSLFSAFDRIAIEHGVEKIKTIGDAYMAAAGLFPPAEHHAERLTRMAARMLDVVAHEMIASSKFPLLSVRIGIDTGPASAGIIGEERFFYDVWGDTVNTASRLESSSQPGRIHIAEGTRSALGPDFRCEPRPPLELKGKGLVQTWFVELDACGESDLPSHRREETGWSLR